MNSKLTGMYTAAILLAGLATHTDALPVDDQAVIQYQQQLEKLDRVNFHPNLLPLILKHSDYLELSAEQVSAFETWRTINAKPMFAAMNEIIRKRIEFREAALSPDNTAEDLRRMQQAIFGLHQKVLDYKLSCRENIMKTFTAQNWDDFFVVLAEEGYAIPSTVSSVDMLGLSVLTE